MIARIGGGVAAGVLGGFAVGGGARLWAEDRADSRRSFGGKIESLIAGAMIDVAAMGAATTGGLVALAAGRPALGAACLGAVAGVMLSVALPAPGP